MTGIVHLAPGRCFFLILYTVCSRTSNAPITARAVTSIERVDSEAEPGWASEKDELAVVEGTEAEVV